jgi:hypothetical protein
MTNKPKRRVLALAAGLLLAPVLTVPAHAQTSQTNTAQAPRPAPTERELFERALNPYSFAGATSRVTWQVGKLPSDLPAPLPALPNVRVVGSVVNTSSRPEISYSAQIFLDSQLTPTIFRRQFVAGLEKGGWKLLPGYGSRTGQRGGFVSTDAGGFLGYVQESKNLMVNIQTQRKDDTTQVSINLRVDPNAKRMLAMSQPDTQSIPLPDLQPPPGATVTAGGGGGGGGGGQFTTSAMIETDLSAAALMTHYGDQLQKAGWSPLSRTLRGAVSVSVWGFQDELKQEAVGLLSLVRGEEGTFRATLASMAER